MGFFLFILFIAVPLLEVWLLVTVGGWIGAGWTVTLVVLTAVAGAALVRAQGLAVLGRMRRDLAANTFPLDSVFDGACLLLAGALLLTPGFLTDTVGLVLLVPGARRALQGALAARTHLVHVEAAAVRAGGRRPDRAGGTVIDGDYQDISDQDTGDRVGGGPENGANPGAPARPD